MGTLSMYLQDLQGLWGLQRDKGEGVSRGVVGMVVGAVVGVGWVVGVVLVRGTGDAAGWAWIDVVSSVYPPGWDGDGMGYTRTVC